MENVLDTPPSDDNAGEICFGDCKDKMEKLKKDFLMLKRKIFCSQDLIKKYNTKVQENERIAADLFTAQMEIKSTEQKLNKRNIKVQSDAVRLKLENEKLRKTHEEIMKQREEYEVKIAGDKQHIQQLICKVEDIEERHSEKLMTIELEKSGLQSKIKELEREIRNLRKERDKTDSKYSKKAGKPKKRGRNLLKTQTIGLPTIGNDLDVIDTDKNAQQSVVSPHESMELLEECKEISVVNTEVQTPADVPEIILENETKVNVSDLESNLPENSLCIDKNIMTDEFYHIEDNPYPLFCQKCRGLLNSIPVDEILDGMRIAPLITEFAPSPVHEKKNKTTAINSNISENLETFEEKLKRLEKEVSKMKKTQNTRNNRVSHCSHSHSNNCCDNSINGSFSLMNMLTTFCSKMLTNKKKKKGRVKRLKRRKRKINREKNNCNNWDVEPLSFAIDESSDVDSEQQNSQMFTPLINSSEINYSDSHSVSSDNMKNVIPERLDKNNSMNNSKKYSIKDVEIVNNYQHTQKPVNNIEEDIPDEENNIRHNDFPSTYVLTNSNDACNESFTSLNLEPENSRERKRKQNGRSNLLTKLRRLKNNSTTFPAKIFRNNNLTNIGSNEEVEVNSVKRKRIAHVPKKISSDDSNFDSVEKNDPEEQIVLKRQRVTRSMVRCHSPISKTVEYKSTSSLLHEEESIVNNLTSVVDDCINFENVHEEKNENSVNNKNQATLESSLDISKKPKDTLNKIQSLSNSNNQETEKSDKTQGLDDSFIDKISSNDNEINDEKEGREVGDILEVSKIRNKIPENLIDVEQSNKNEVNDEIAFENNPDIFDESPASPDKEEFVEISSAVLPSVSSLYESVTLDESSVSSTPTTISEPSEKVEVVTTPKVSKPTDEYYKNCVKTLRNRTVSISPSKCHSAAIRSDTTPCGNKNKFVSYNDSSQSLLDQYIARGKQKPVGKVQKFRNESAIKLAKGVEEYVNMELRNLIDSETWTSSINQEIVNNLKTVNNRSLAKAVVDFMINMSDLNEPLDRTFTPPAPMMTKSEQKIVALLQKLDKEKSIIFDVLNNIEYALFRINSDITYEAAEELARIFTVLAKIKKDRERVRIMCCDALYCLQKKGLIALSAVITSWPEILPSYQENQFQYLPVCIAYVVKTFKHTSKDTCTKIMQLNKLIKSLYNYPDEFFTSKSFVDKLLTDLMTPGHDRSVSTAIILLSKKEGSEWTYKNIISGGLLKIIVENKSSNVCEALKLLGYLMKSFPTTDENGTVGKVIDQLCAILDSGATSADIQEGVVFALLSLSRHNFNRVAESITVWHPPQNLPPELEEQLETFFNLRSVDFWRQFKKKKKKN